MSGIKGWVKGTWGRSLMGRALLVAPPVAVVVLAGFWAYGSRQPVQYYTARVEKGNIAQVVQATGTINAVTTVQVGSQVSGNIAKLFADFNSQVKRNQIIAQIDPATLQARLMQAEADMDNARANVKGLEAQIDVQKADVLAVKAGVDRARAQAKEAEQNLGRTKELFAQGILSAAQLDTAQSNADAAVASLRVTEAQVVQSNARLKSTIAQLDQAKAQVAQRKASAELARVDLAHTTIRAPIDGTVIARNVDVGQTVAASLQAPTLFVLAQDLTKMLVYAKTDEADVGKIKVGAMATFRVDSFPREMFRGMVKQVRMNATMVQNVVTYDTIIEFDNADQKLFPGMTAYVSIPVAWANDTVKIPNGAMRFKPEMTEEERKELLAKFNISEDGPGAGQRRAGAGGAGGAGGRPAGGNGGGEAASGAPGKGGMMRRGGGEGEPGGGAPSRMGGGSQRDDWATVWKLLPNKSLEPMRVKLGVTDFTFTQMVEGSLQAGEELVIGQSSKNSTAQQQGGSRPPGMGGPSGPGGMPRRM